jgi:hypothetical protein
MSAIFRPLKAKAFFSEEKKQKTFISPPAPTSRPWPESWVQHRNKSLLVLFFRKEHLSYAFSTSPYKAP